MDTGIKTGVPWSSYLKCFSVYSKATTSEIITLNFKGMVINLGGPPNHQNNNVGKF